MTSNYPPGVTGNEYAIAGPDTETDVEGVCTACGADGDLMVRTFHGERWVDCAACGDEQDEQGEDTRDPDAEYDRRRDERDEREWFE